MQLFFQDQNLFLMNNEEAELDLEAVSQRENIFRNNFFSSSFSEKIVQTEFAAVAPGWVKDDEKQDKWLASV